MPKRIRSSSGTRERSPQERPSTNQWNIQAIYYQSLGLCSSPLVQPPPPTLGATQCYKMLHKSEKSALHSHPWVSPPPSRQIWLALQINPLILKTQLGSSGQFFTHPNPAAECPNLHILHNLRKRIAPSPARPLTRSPLHSRSPSSPPSETSPPPTPHRSR